MEKRQAVEACFLMQKSKLRSLWKLAQSKLPILPTEWRRIKFRLDRPTKISEDELDLIALFFDKLQEEDFEDNSLTDFYRVNVWEDMAHKMEALLAINGKIPKSWMEKMYRNGGQINLYACKNWIYLGSPFTDMLIREEIPEDMAESLWKYGVLRVHASSDWANSSSWEDRNDYGADIIVDALSSGVMYKSWQDNLIKSMQTCEIHRSGQIREWFASALFQGKLSQELTTAVGNTLRLGCIEDEIADKMVEKGLDKWPQVLVDGFFQFLENNKNNVNLRHWIFEYLEHFNFDKLVNKLHGANGISDKKGLENWMRRYIDRRK